MKMPWVALYIGKHGAVRFMRGVAATGIWRGGWLISFDVPLQVKARSVAIHYLVFFGRLFPDATVLELGAGFTRAATAIDRRR